MNKITRRFGSGTLMIFLSFGQPQKELDDFLERLNNFHPILKFTHEHSREEINFLDVTVRVNHGEFITSLYCKKLMVISTFTWSHVTLVTQIFNYF